LKIVTKSLIIPLNKHCISSILISMKKLSPFLFLTLLFIASACGHKKDDPQPDTTNDPVFSINLQMARSVFVNHDSLFYLPADTMGIASFIDEKANHYHVNSVSLNGIVLGIDTVDNDYRSHISDLSKCVWSVKGKDGIPDFDYSNTNGMPDYTGYNLLPDSIDHTKNLTIQLTGITNATNFAISLTSFQGNVTSDVVDASTPSITFSAAQLARLQLGGCFIAVSVYNDNTQMVNGHYFFLTNSLSSFKWITIY